MNAKDRYYQAKDGKLSFRVREHTTGVDDEISPWVPIDQVEINDSLACSRDQLGPVYVTDPERVVRELVAVRVDFLMVWSAESRGPEPIALYELSTPQELEDAGLWDNE